MIFHKIITIITIMVIIIMIIITNSSNNNNNIIYSSSIIHHYTIYIQYNVHLQDRIREPVSIVLYLAKVALSILSGLSVKNRHEGQNNATPVANDVTGYLMINSSNIIPHIMV